jgi:hypothetical protein
MGVELIADVICLNVDVFGFFTGSFSSMDFPCLAPVVGSACDLPCTAELFLSALCNVLAKSLAPCSADWEGKIGLLGEPDDTGSAWITLVSTKSVSRSAIPLMHAEHQRRMPSFSCRGKLASG